MDLSLRDKAAIVTGGSRGVGRAIALVLGDEGCRYPVILSAAKNPFDLLPVVPYYIYILASYTKRLYIGVTNNLERRVWEHKSGDVPGFTSRYKITKLVYREDYKYVRDALGREKSLKGLLRAKKIELIESTDPEWDDIAGHWYSGLGDSSLRSE